LIGGEYVRRESLTQKVDPIAPNTKFDKNLISFSLFSAIFITLLIGFKFAIIYFLGVISGILIIAFFG
jgi:hypothetical protein